MSKTNIVSLINSRIRQELAEQGDQRNNEIKVLHEDMARNGQINGTPCIIRVQSFCSQEIKDATNLICKIINEFIKTSGEKYSDELSVELKKKVKENFNNIGNYQNRHPKINIKAQSTIEYEFKRAESEINNERNRGLDKINTEIDLLMLALKDHKKINDRESNFLRTQNKPEDFFSHEIASGLKKFRKDYPSGTKTAFIIMQFDETNSHKTITKLIKKTLSQHGITALRADDKEYMDDLFPNIKVYMHACDFGVAVFDRIIENDFNPNVTLEVGYILGMRKDVLLLKDKTLKELSTDLTGRLYKSFDTTDIENTLPKQIEKWLMDKELTKP